MLVNPSLNRIITIVAIEQITNANAALW